MKPINKKMILCLLFMSIFLLYFVTENMNSPKPTKNEKLYDKFSGTMGVKRRIDSPLSLNPYDNHFSYLENLIVWISLFWGMWFFSDIFFYLKKQNNEKILMATKPI